MSTSVRRDFLRRFFHDLATPLSAVSLHLQGADRRIRRGADPTEPLGIAQAELIRAIELFEHARDCLLAPEGSAETFSFDDFVESTIQTNGGPRIALEGRTGGQITSDRGALSQALMALMANAVEASGADAVRVRRKRDGPWLQVEIENPGRLPVADPESLFSPRVARAGRQWGMGLPRARLQAAAAGGTVRLEQNEESVIATLRLPEEQREDPHRRR